MTIFAGMIRRDQAAVVSETSGMGLDGKHSFKLDKVFSMPVFGALVFGTGEASFPTCFLREAEIAGYKSFDHLLKNLGNQAKQNFDNLLPAILQSQGYSSFEEWKRENEPGEGQTKSQHPAQSALYVGINIIGYSETRDQMVMVTAQYSDGFQPHVLPAGNFFATYQEALEPYTQAKGRTPRNADDLAELLGFQKKIIEQQGLLDSMPGMIGGEVVLNYTDESRTIKTQVLGTMEDCERMAESLESRAGASNVERSQHPSRKVGRNEPCPCGSSKKYKKCCGK